MIRTVDQSKCVGCGTCQKVCPLDVFRLETRQLAVSPCKYACPIQNDMREMHYLLQMGRVDDAARTMLGNNPLASVTGRICPAFCESECTRAQVDSAVNISAIEQYLGDYLLGEKVEPVPRRHVAPIAVVGSGPASRVSVQERLSDTERHARDALPLADGQSGRCCPDDARE